MVERNVYDHLRRKRGSEWYVLQAFFRFVIIVNPVIGRGQVEIGVTLAFFGGLQRTDRTPADGLAFDRRSLIGHCSKLNLITPIGPIEQPPANLLSIYHFTGNDWNRRADGCTARRR